MTEQASLAPETAWRNRPDRLRWLVMAVDVLATVALFVGSLLFLLPLTPHLEISSDSMDPFGHAWSIWTGRAHPLSSHNLLYAYGRAWTSLALLLGADGLEGIAARMAVATSAMTPIVYVAGRVLTGGISAGINGQPVRRVGAVLGPLLGAMLFVRFPGFLWSQVAGSHVYLSAEWAGLGLLPLVMLMRAADLGGGDQGPLRALRGPALSAVLLGVCIAMSTLNHPYGASQFGILLPLGALLVARLGRRGLVLIGLATGAAALMVAPHALHLLSARSGMGESLVQYARSDAEFGYLTWAQSFHRVTMARSESFQGWLMFQAPVAALVTGVLAMRRRPRLGGATAMLGAISLSTVVAEVLLTRISQHIQPYHWHPLLPLAALSAALTFATLLDMALRRARRERIRDAERGRGVQAVVGRRLPIALVATALIAYTGQGLYRSLTEDRGYLETLWDISRLRQAFHHDIVARSMLADLDDAGRTPVLGGIDFPDFSVTLDPIALTFELISRGQSMEEVARDPGEHESMMLHIGLAERDPMPLLYPLPDGVRLVRGDSEFLLLRGTTATLRAWSRRLCDRPPGPHALMSEGRSPYRVRGSLETRHLVLGNDQHPSPYPWSHPCMEPFAWPDISDGEYPLMPEGTAPGDLVGTDKYVWAELGPLFASRTETTTRDWARCVQAGACEALAEPSPEDGWLPIVGTTPAQALAYCRWLADGTEWEGRTWTGDLPNSIEFEVLGSWRRSVSESRTRWPWGDEPGEGLANGAGDADGYAGVAPVGSFSVGRSPMSLEDVAGNVAEWVHRATRPSREDEHPWGRTLPGYLLAGGSFRSETDAMRNGVFETPAEDRALDDVGFRCVIRGEDP